MKHIACFLLLAITWASPGIRAERPNIIVFMLDDLGYSDFGCYGGEVHTPHIDSLATGGLRFTRFYNASRCCPTRAALLTGLYPHQVGLKVNGRSLTRNGVTIAEALGAHGYQTAMVGKWHLTQTPILKGKHQQWLDKQIEPDIPFGPIHTYPIHRGFDRHYGIIWGVVNYFDPFSLVDGEHAVKQVDKDYYITNAINERAVKYVQTMSENNAPFFMYVAHTAPHWPLHALPEDIAKYDGVYESGWQDLRQKRYARQIQMGLIDAKTHPLPPLDPNPSWQNKPEKDRAMMAAKMAVHAAMIDRVDQGMGQLIDALKKAGRFENTLIMVLSDNGASPEDPARWGPGYDRTSMTRDGKKVRYKGYDTPGSETTYAGIGAAWANAANTPFRFWKKESYEGGCHTPMIVHWPAGLKTKEGALTDQMGHVIDIMPTCLELAKVAYPKKFNDKTITPVEGKSLVPVFSGQQRTPHDHLGFEHVGGRAYIHGGWKIASQKGRAWELFHLDQDRTETKNLAASHPEKLDTLKSKWDQWAKRVGVLAAKPKKKPKPSPSKK